MIDQLLPAGGLGILHGPPGLRKTFIALHLAAASSRGEPFLGVFPTRAGQVVFIELDVPEAEWYRRFQLAGDRLDKVWCVFDHKLWNITDMRTPNPELQTLKGRLTEPPTLVIVDTLRKSHILDENASLTPTLVYDAWHRHFPHSALLFLHHDRKVGELSRGEQGDRETAMGSQTWTGNPDLTMHLTRFRRKAGTQAGPVVGPPPTATLTFTKTRASTEGEPMPIDLAFDEIGWPLPTAGSAFGAARNFAAAHPDRDAVRRYAEGELGASRATAFRWAATLVP